MIFDLVCVWLVSLLPFKVVYRLVISDIGWLCVKSVISVFMCVWLLLLFASNVVYKSVILEIVCTCPVSDLLFNEVYKFVISDIGWICDDGVKVIGTLLKLLYEYGTKAVLISYAVKLVISLMVC